METAIVITEEQALEKMKIELPNGVDLYYVDYRDSIDSPKDQQQILKQWYLDDDVCQYRDDCIEDTIRDIISNIFSSEEMEYIKSEEWNDVRYTVRDWCYDNDSSNPLKDLCRNTWSVPVRIETYSNYDCINSLMYTDISYPDSYIWDIIDVLHINPREVYDILKDQPQLQWQEQWPDIPERNPYISAKDFCSELYDSWPACVWTFVWLADMEDCYGNNGVWTKFIIPKWNKAWFFWNSQWTWSCIEAVLLRDIEIDLTSPAREWSTFKRFWIMVDESESYSMREVYWPTKAFYCNEIILIPHDNKNENI